MHHIATAAKCVATNAKMNMQENEKETFDRLRYGKCYKTHCGNTGVEPWPCQFLSSISAGKLQQICNCCQYCREHCGVVGYRHLWPSGPNDSRPVDHNFD
jgi:hypothetical protein